jgi:uncharacterized protein YegL
MKRKNKVLSLFKHSTISYREKHSKISEGYIMNTIKFNDIDPGNPTKRVPTTLILDCSSSMFGNSIGALNAGVLTLKEEVEKDEQACLSVDLSVISFGGTVSIRHDFSSIEHFNPQPIQACGDTPMGQAIMMSLDNCEKRKSFYRENGIPIYRPWLFLITDGAPTDEWQTAAKRVRQGEVEKKFLFFAVGVAGANMDIFTQIAPPERPPVLLNGLSFKEMFLWLRAYPKTPAARNVITEQAR